MNFLRNIKRLFSSKDTYFFYVTYGKRDRDGAYVKTNSISGTFATNDECVASILMQLQNYICDELKKSEEFKNTDFGFSIECLSKL